MWYMWLYGGGYGQNMCRSNEVDGDLCHSYAKNLFSVSALDCGSWNRLERF